VLRAAVEYEYLQKNPLDNLKLPPDKRGKQAKPWVTPQQFFQMLDLISEPYATIVYAAVFTGLRVSELAALKWRCIHKDSITIEQRFCRGDWSCTKSDASAATIAVQEKLIERILQLKNSLFPIRAGRAVRQCKVGEAGRS
jgi:integrase